MCLWWSSFRPTSSHLSFYVDKVCCVANAIVSQSLSGGSWEESARKANIPPTREIGRIWIRCMRRNLASPTTKWGSLAPYQMRWTAVSKCMTLWVGPPWLLAAPPWHVWHLGLGSNPTAGHSTPLDGGLPQVLRKVVTSFLEHSSHLSSSPPHFYKANYHLFLHSPFNLPLVHAPATLYFFFIPCRHTFDSSIMFLLSDSIAWIVVMQ